MDDRRLDAQSSPSQVHKFIGILRIISNHDKTLNNEPDHYEISSGTLRTIKRDTYVYYSMLQKFLAQECVIDVETILAQLLIHVYFMDNWTLLFFFFFTCSLQNKGYHLMHQLGEKVHDCQCSNCYLVFLFSQENIIQIHWTYLSASCLGQCLSLASQERSIIF